jgi:DNA-binding winged helix-turn-helix (wHTH) protein/TolB-like protein/Tfp pilus assembly protein PilF
VDFDLAMALKGQTLYEFGSFRLDPANRQLLDQGRALSLTPKALEILVVLVQNGNRLTTKEELMRRVWPDSFVEEANLTVNISALRKLLGETVDGRQYIQTVPKSGYRFSVPVSVVEEKGQTVSVEDNGKPRQTNPIATSGQVPINNTSGLLEETLGPRRWRKRILALGLVLIGVVLFGYTAYRVRTILKQRVLPVEARSLAILPLQNLRQDSDSEFLGFSLADAVITKLDYVSSLTVRPSSAVEKYRGKAIDIQTVAADLKVDTLLTGSFIRDGDDLRITYQLIDVKTEKILGRGTIDLKYDNLLKVQDTVAQQIIQKLELNLSPSEAERIKPESPVTPLAYEYYLRGVDLYGQNKFPLAIKMLEKSTEIDPNYAPAWAYLGTSYTADAAFEFGGREQYRRAQAAYERALAIRPSQLDAQIFLANLLIDTGKVEQAVPLLRDALKTNPNHAAAHWELGYAYRFAGMLNESVTECEGARRLDPLVKANSSAFNTYLYLGDYTKFLRSLPDVDGSSFLLFYRGLGEYYQKDFERAARDFDRAYEVDPTLYAQIGKALSESIAHRGANGLEILQGLEGKIEHRGVGDPEATYKIAQAYSMLGDKVSALRVLRSSVEGGFFSYPYLSTDPLLEPLRKESEFAEILNTSHQRYEAFRSRFF